MDFREEEYNHYKYAIADLDYAYDKDFLDMVDKKGREDAEKQNKNDTSGRIRGKNEIIFKNIGGVLAEKVVKEYLKKLISDSKIDAKIIPTPFTDHETHRDIKIEVNGNIKTIEVRSSFQTSPYLQIIGILTKHFSLIGRYTTAYKKNEVKKDYYITVLHRYKHEEIVYKIKNKVEAYIIGGASNEVFEEIGYDDNKKLKQGEACYRIINPIILTPKDTIEIFNEILEIKTKSEEKEVTL